MVKKQKIMIIALAATFALLTLLYFLVIAPLVQKRADENKVTVEPPKLLEGEALDEDGTTILVFPYTERKKIKSIEVKNQHGSFTCYRRDNTEEFYFRDYEQAPLSAETLASLVVAAGYTGTVERVTEKCEDWATYGLSDEDTPAWYKLTLLDGTTHEVYIGDLIPSGGGYYCRYKDRDALYVLSNTIANTLLVPVETLITPYLGFILDSKTYSITDEFVLLKNGENFVYITYDESTADTEETVVSAYDMMFPASYTVDDTRYSEVLLSFCGLKGYATIKVGKVDEMLHDDEEIMATYGFEDINNSPYELYYRYGDAESLVLFAPSGIDGYYFAYSYLFNLIALVEKSAVPYLEWDIREYINDQLFHESINDVSKIEISGTVDDLNGKKEIHEVFDLKGTGADIIITPQSTGKVFTTDQIRNFRQFYMIMLLVNIQGYMKSEGVDDYSSLEETATVKVTMDDGTVLEYKYYSYSSRRCYATINGEGEFYVNKKDIYKLLTDANRAARGLTVDRNLEYSDYVD
ncbi:MAG: DUF4340 domain-containing protein [Clostridia bacterium]|nr:DUF4340 domain-containing protein [Clostridia bacterium]